MVNLNDGAHDSLLSVSVHCPGTASRILSSPAADNGIVCFRSVGIFGSLRSFGELGRFAPRQKDS